MWGRLEHEIRLLPQVLACSITQDDVVVLVQPSADGVEAESAVLGILRRAGLSHRVRVLGGVAPLVVHAAPPRPSPRRSPAVLVGTVAATGILALSSLVGGLSAVDDDRAAPSAPKGRAPAPTFFEPDTPLRRINAAIDDPAPNEGGRRIPPRTTSRDENTAPLPGHTPTGETPNTPTPPSSSPTDWSGCDRPRRDAARTRPGAAQGNGPRPWSWSVLIGPHDDCSRGRPR